MEENKTEVFVSLAKTDTVVAIENNILAETLVFESLNPFPGYYHEFPDDLDSVYVYLVLDKQYTLDEILRATQTIEKKYNWNFDVGKAYLAVGTSNLFAIRVRHLPSLDLIRKIQEAYADYGIRFLKKKRFQGKLESQVKIVKFLELEELADGIYLNALDKSFAYFEISEYLSSEKFKKVSLDVKYNWDGHEFDAASASFYKNGKLSEAVRIYSDQIDLDYLKAIQRLYISKMG